MEIKKDELKFNNIMNKCYQIEGKDFWDSRSSAVSGVIFAWRKSDLYPHVLVSKRGPHSADFKGAMNVTCGYIDWNESATDAMIRETWEEVGLNLYNILETKKDVINNLNQPWYVASNPSQNRQNITMRFGLCFTLEDNEDFPKLSVEHNEVIGEVEEPQWIPFQDIDKYVWAFEHDIVINNYLVYILNTPNFSLFKLFKKIMVWLFGKITKLLKNKR